MLMRCSVDSNVGHLGVVCSLFVLAIGGSADFGRGCNALGDLRRQRHVRIYGGDGLLEPSLNVL